MEKNDMEKKVVLSEDDCLDIIGFWREFNLDVPENLHKALNNFIENPTIENQDAIKNELCKEISAGNHVMLKDPALCDVISETFKVGFNNTFDKDVDQLLSDK